MKKQIFFCLGLPLLLINLLSFPMEHLLESSSHTESSSIAVNNEQAPCQRYIESACCLRQQNNEYHHDMDIEHLLNKYLANKKIISATLQNIPLPFYNSPTDEPSPKHLDISYIPDSKAIEQLAYIQQLLSKPDYIIDPSRNNNNQIIKSFLIKCLNNQTVTLDKISNFPVNNPGHNNVPTANQQETRGIDSTSHTGSSEAHNTRSETQVDTSALLSDEEAQRFMASAPTSNARIIINMIMKRCFKTSPHKGSLIISFIGENGTGKTSLIKAIIVTLQRPFAFIPAQEIMDQDQHSVLQHIKNTIRPFLERDMPCVIALDDIDKFYSPHEIYTEKLKPDQLLSYYLDEAKAKDKNRQKPHFIILSSANQQKNLSDMFCARSQIVEIGKPDYSSRFKILTDLIKDASISYEHISIEDLAKRTESLSIKNLSDLIDLSVLLNDTKDIPYYYLSKTCIEQMLKELLPEKEIKREEEEEEEESLSVKNVGKQYQDRTSSVILSTVGNIIKFVITKATQDWLLSLIQRKIMPK